MKLYYNLYAYAFNATANWFCMRMPMKFVDDDCDAELKSRLPRLVQGPGIGLNKKTRRQIDIN